jgi:RimJ/RimL family protein N-acetyltransferase
VPATAQITLRDGATLDVRPVESGDAQLLEDALEHLSPRSRYRRFLAPVDHLEARQLHYLTTIDHERHEALIALDPASKEAVAVARYVELAEDPETAEIAVTVADAWQGRGVGTALMNLLAAKARAHGLRRFSGLMLSENVAMFKLMRSLGFVVAQRHDAGTVEVLVGLAEAAAAQR